MNLYQKEMTFRVNELFVIFTGELTSTQTDKLCASQKPLHLLQRTALCDTVQKLHNMRCVNSSTSFELQKIA